ncbi:MAG: hypothetical protein JW797_01585 [Bradymonadales bacterium]|nr:hypothetical protein [Bradymonadales bacterium]
MKITKEHQDNPTARKTELASTGSARELQMPEHGGQPSCLQELPPSPAGGGGGDRGEGASIRTGWLPVLLALTCVGAWLAACSDDAPDSFTVSCVDTRDCPSGQYCFCGGICVTPTRCENNGDCCDNENCQSGLCLQQNICSNDNECSRKRTCQSCFCAPRSCSTDEQCDPDEICDGGACLDAQEFPCLGACDGIETICAPVRDACVPFPESCRQLTCGPGETPILAGVSERLGPSCQQPPRCVCGRSREVPPGYLGMEFSALYLGGLSFAALAYDLRYGDLVYLVFSGTEIAGQPFYLDGVPAVPPRGSLDGRRGGVYEPGPDRGRMPSAAAGSGTLAVAYRDATDGDLWFAQSSTTGQWQTSLVEFAGDTGYYPSLAHRNSDGWSVTFFALDAGQSALRLATTSVESPSGPTDWLVSTLDSGPGELLAGTDLPRGTGLFPSLAMVNGELFVAYYDGLWGDLRLARVDTAGSAETFLLDTGATRSSIADAGDVGIAIDLEPAPDGTLKIAYVDRISSEVWFASVDLSQPSTEPLQLTEPPELVDPGRDASPPLLVGGGGIDLAFDGQGQPMIAYQDNTNGDLILATRSGQGWVRNPIASEGVAGFSPHLFPGVEGQTWILFGQVTDLGGGELVQSIRAAQVN